MRLRTALARIAANLHGVGQARHRRRDALTDRSLQICGDLTDGKRRCLIVE
jgi:hypothetical protein